MSSHKHIMVGLAALLAALVCPGHTHAADDAQSRPRILIVPGHEPVAGGAEFLSLKERDIAVELGQDLERLLRFDGGYKVYITRDTQAWSPVFADYFDSNWDGILAWEKQAKKDLSHQVSLGLTTKATPTILHNKADAEVGVRLYGIIKWANENDIDLMLHIHINDDAVHSVKSSGKFSGFAIYAPVDQYENGTTSHAIAEALLKRLSEYNPVSNLKQESAGIVSDPELIALGANNTSKVPSLLIEYDYIYASELADPKVRSLALKDMAYATYRGLEDFYGKEEQRTAGSHGTAILPYLWLGPVTSTSSASDIYALQTTLSAVGMYPPSGKTKNECPRTGLFGVCTKNALKAFQDKNGISDEPGAAGERTIDILHSNF